MFRSAELEHAPTSFTAVRIFHKLLIWGSPRNLWCGRDFDPPKGTFLVLFCDLVVSVHLQSFYLIVYIPVSQSFTGLGHRSPSGRRQIRTINYIFFTPQAMQEFNRSIEAEMI